MAVAFIAATARFSLPVPGSPVPQSLQTLGVALVGAWLGAREAGVALVVYLAVGAFGQPVFADGAAGASHLVGPTAGYLVGFVAGAVLVGWWADVEQSASLGSGLLQAFLCICGAHAVILGFGWLRLSLAIGPGAALSGGVTPFLWGGVVKSALGATGWATVRAARGGVPPRVTETP